MDFLGKALQQLEQTGIFGVDTTACVENEILALVGKTVVTITGFVDEAGKSVMASVEVGEKLEVVVIEIVDVREVGETVDVGEAAEVGEIVEVTEIEVGVDSIVDKVSKGVDGKLID